MNRKCLLALWAGLLLAVVCVSATVSAQTIDESLFKGLKYRQVGPFRGGRALAVAGIPGNPYTFYFGAVAGGVWKTTDAGKSWLPLTDSTSIASVGAIAVAQSDPNVIYVGSGEACLRGNITVGDGVYKSVDAGKTWKNVGLKDSQHIGAIIVHPKNPDIAFVAALGHAYGPNEMRGVYRTLDGGKTWEKVLNKDENTGAIQVIFDPNNANVLWAAMYQIRRSPYDLVSGGPGSGLYKSSDAGTTWKRVEGGGFPKGILGRIGVAVSGANSDRVYALVEAEEGGLYVSDDGGDKWTKANDEQRIRQRAWYFSHIWADPKSLDTVYIANTGLLKSTDGGKTLSLLNAPHGDHHGLWIDPVNPNRMINSSDGGATVSLDGGISWSSEYNQPTAQFYHVSADSRFLYHLYGAQQDNTTVAIAAKTDDGYISERHWYEVFGGESGYIVVDPRDPDLIYAGDNGGKLNRYDRKAEQVQDISVWPEDMSGHGAADLKYRLAWTQPVLISPNDPNTLYTATEQIFKSTDQGKSWAAISGDLTRNDKSKQQSSGGPLTKDNTSVEVYNTVFALAESPKQAGVIWAGTDDGLIHVTRDGGKSWENVTPKGDNIEWAQVSILEASPFDAGTAYAAVNRYKLDDLKPYIFKTTDFGKTWSKIVNGIPEGSFLRSVREDPSKKGLLFAGTETGVFVSFNGGANWQALKLNLPQTPIHDLIIKGDDLALATHGRAFWVLDNISPLRQADASILAKEAHLFVPPLSYRWRFAEGVDKRRPVAIDPPQGVAFDYYLKSALKDKEEITLEVLDATSKLVRKYSSIEKPKDDQPQEWPNQEVPSDRLPAEVGLNRFYWDFRTEGPTKIPGEVSGDFRSRGIAMPPGKYQVRLTVAGKSYTQPLELRIDPRVTSTPDEQTKQYELAVRINGSLTGLHTAINQIRDTRAQLKSLQKRMGSDAQGAQYKDIATAADALDKKMTPVEEQMLQVKIKASEGNLGFPVLIDERLHALQGSVESDFAPTKQQYDVYEKLNGELTPLLAQWNQIRDKDVQALNDMVKSKQVPAVVLGGQ